MVRKIAQPEGSLPTGLQLLVISVIEVSPSEQNQIAFLRGRKSRLLSVLGSKSSQVPLACQHEGFVTGDQMIVKLHIWSVIQVFPTLLPPQ